MNNNSNDDVIDIKILDRVYKIKCTPDEAHELQASAHYVDAQMRKMRQSSSTKNADRVAVVTALNICHELLQTKEQLNQSIQTMNQRIQDLHNRVKNSLGTQEEITV